MNQMCTIMRLPKFLLCILAASILFSAVTASAIAAPRQGADLLLDTYQKHRAGLGTNTFGLPLVVESFERGDRVNVDVYGIFDYPFDSVVDALKVPAHWCDIVFLHPNVKACTYRELPGDRLLAFYPGKKVYQAPDESRRVNYHYRVVTQNPGYLDITLRAEAGPYGTKDHRMRFEALPLNGGRTFVHVSYAYSDSAALRLVAKIYFATLARDKVGFTVTGKDRDGKPVHIGGPRGALERSAVRYYLAIQSFMNTLRYPEENRFSMRINQWHDLTSRFRKQLFDLDKKEYLTSKTAEHRNQVKLQREISTTPIHK